MTVQRDIVGRLRGSDIDFQVLYLRSPPEIIDYDPYDIGARQRIAEELFDAQEKDLSIESVACGVALF